MSIFKTNYLIIGAAAFVLLGMWNCAPERAVKLDPETAEFYETTRLIMTDDEKDIFNHLPSNELRKEFIQEFWEKRDPDPDTEVNEFKQEYFRRIEYANERYNEGTPGWKTDRGRIYVYLGAPDKIDEIFNHDATDSNGDPIRGSLLLWVYYRYDFAVQFYDKSGIGHFTMDPYYGVIGDIFLAIEKAKMGMGFKDEEFRSSFWDFDLEYDVSAQEFRLEIPAEDLIFKEEEGLLKADFQVEFFIYPDDGSGKFEFKDTINFEEEEQELLKKEKINFTFPYQLSPGKYKVDVVIIAEPDVGRSRKIFNIKV
ncbi:MAG: GWxTD domain-containing protein [Candidatus Aminicenantes bacterium]|nr:GWxTD domain-containing protein [Candidatus Aminicenantes bacterium]